MHLNDLHYIFPTHPVLLTDGPGDPLTKSPVELHRFPMPPLLIPPIPTAEAVKFCIFGCLGDGDGAGDIEWLLIESECSEPFEWWIAFCARLLALAVDMFRDGELVTRDGTRPKRFSSTLELTEMGMKGFSGYDFEVVPGWVLTSSDGIPRKPETFAGHYGTAV